MLAGKLYGIPIKGTHAHSFVSSYYEPKELKIKTCKSLITGELVDIDELSKDYLKQMQENGFNFLESECNKGELAAFVTFAIAFPSEFLALVDTYNVLKYVEN